MLIYCLIVFPYILRLSSVNLFEIINMSYILKRYSALDKNLIIDIVKSRSLPARIATKMTFSLSSEP